MHIVFASGDVGGARALKPVIQLALKSGIRISVLRHGALLNEGKLDIPDALWFDFSNLSDLLVSEPASKVLVYATSVSDYLASHVAARFESEQLPTIHVLDNWINYKSRLLLPDGAELNPTFYTVMDEFAYNNAIEEGVKIQSLVTTGTPALGDVQPATKKRNGKIIFISEPLSTDHKEKSGRLTKREYCEYSVLDEVLNCINLMKIQQSLCIFLHPRERLDASVGPLVEKYHFLKPEIVSEIHKAEYLEGASAVIGMTSIMTYRAWLMGIPTLSLQIGTSNPASHFVGLEGLITVHEREKIGCGIERLGQVEYSEQIKQAQHRLRSHQNAARNIIDLAVKACKLRPTLKEVGAYDA